MEIKCPNCGKTLEQPDNAVGVKVRCSFCRATFIGEEPALSLAAPTGTGLRFCPNCGAKADAGFKFCANCGQPFGTASSVRKTSRATSPMVDCVVCGKHMRESTAVKCPRCGKDVCKTHYNKKLDVCSQCVPVVMGELAEKAVQTGVDGDWNLALNIAKHAEKDDPRVLYVYAKAYQRQVPSLAYHSWEHNWQKYQEYLRASAGAGYAVAQYELGHNQTHFELFGLPSLLKAAEQEYVPAQMEIAQKYREGFKGRDDALVKNASIAFKWYKRAADNGDAEACYRVAVSYITSSGVGFDSETSLMWLRRAADKGHAAALSLLGHYYRNGRFIEQDSYKALECYLAAADKGDDLARRYLVSSIVRSKYVVVDLTGGLNVERFPVHEFDDEGSSTIDSDRWPDKYKMDYLLLRRIEPGQCVNRYGQIIKITKPFYLGVFPVTQYQWELVMGSRPSYFCNEDFYKMRPVESITYGNVRGRESLVNKLYSCRDDCFIGVLRRKTSLEFDLPTSCQWEFACRAGTVGAYYGGYDSPRNLARYAGENTSDDSKKNCDLSDGTITVGSFYPNPWGLYDMLGNVHEYCRDASASKLRALNVDFVGNTWEVDLRGGCWASDDRNVASSAYFHAGTQYNTKSNGIGFRVALEFIDWEAPCL